MKLRELLDHVTWGTKTIIYDLDNDKEIFSGLSNRAREDDNLRNTEVITINLWDDFLAIWIKD